MTLRPLPLCVGLALAGCAGGGSLLEGEPTDDLPSWSVPVDWEPCSLYSGGGGGPAECASIRVPLAWDEPTGPQINLFVKRIAAEGVAFDEASRAVWPLSGGPGGASNLQEPLVDLFLGNDDDLVFYLLDHRGTGRSARLGCSGEDPSSPGGRSLLVDELGPCGEEVRDRWGDDLAGFSTTAAATNLAWLVDATRAPGQHVHLHGGSYGTRWMQRTLQLAPHAADSASGLGVVPPGFAFDDYDASYDRTGRAYLELCVDDVDCVARLGPEPTDVVLAGLGALQTGACPVNADVPLTAERLRSYFGATLLAGGDQRIAIPAIAHRLERCNGDDREALRWFADNVSDPLQALRSDPLYAPVLGNLIILGELWDGGPGVDDALAAHRGSPFSLGSTLRLARMEEVDFPRVARDSLTDERLDVDIPMLWINGELDPATPLEPVLAMVEDQDAQLLVIPGGGHGWTSPTQEGYDCALTTWWNFVREPSDELFDCTYQVLPPDLGGSESLAWSLFGRDDLWGAYQGD